MSLERGTELGKEQLRELDGGSVCRNGGSGKTSLLSERRLSWDRSLFSKVMTVSKWPQVAPREV